MSDSPDSSGSSPEMITGSGGKLSNNVLPSGYRRDLRGLREVERALKRVADRKLANLRPCLAEVVAYVQRESMKRTPIRTGNLQGSHRSRVIGRGMKAVGAIYLTAYYALFVHEAPPSTKFRSPWPRGRKYLERALVESTPKLRGIIRDWMRR